jgi:hypothetical protein
MKYLKILLSAAAALTIVSTALAFKVKTFTLGDVYCFTTSPIQNISCAGQPGGTRQKIISVSSGGSTANPCPSGANPYLSTATSCIPFPTGTQFVSDPE